MSDIKYQISTIKSQLASAYPADEADALAWWIAEEVTGLSRTELQFGCKDTKNFAHTQEIIERLLRFEPIQYIFGHTLWYGLDLNVTPATLMPRPETEFLCHTILAAAAGTPAVVDLCTGSGCIAWTLAAEIPGAEVTGVDISPEALTVARGQQVACHRAPSFVQADILADPPASLPEASFDLLTANPPYVMDRERAAMRPNVLEHEPALALFVPDEDPLVFYRAVARWARTLLRPGGWGYAEINALLGPETAAVFRDAGFSGVSLLQDLGGASRFVRFFI